MTRLYHATFPSRADAIEKEGIRAAGDGFVYMANNPGYAAGFLRLRGGEYVGEKWLNLPMLGLNGPVIGFPNIITHDTIAVFEIDEMMLNPNRLHVSTDHASSIAPPDLVSIAHDGDIPPEAIVRVADQPWGVPE